LNPPFGQLQFPNKSATFANHPAPSGKRSPVLPISTPTPYPFRHDLLCFIQWETKGSWAMGWNLLWSSILFIIAFLTRWNKYIFSNFSCMFLNPNNLNVIQKGIQWHFFTPACKDDGHVKSFFPNSLRPISYLGFIWDLYVLGLKTKVFCRKNNQIYFPMDKGLTVPK
jgi:hypothetical protein